MREYQSPGSPPRLAHQSKRRHGRNLPPRPARRDATPTRHALGRGRPAGVCARPEGDLVRLKGSDTVRRTKMKPIDAWSRLIVREARGSMSQFIAKKCRTRLGPGSAGRLMTPEEFDSAPEWAWRKGYRYELIRDVLVVSPFLEAAIRDCNDHMGYWLRRYQDSDPRGSALDATLPEHIVYTNNRRWADRVVWTGLGRIPNPETEQPSIVIEFVSFRRRDAIARLGAEAR